MKKDDVQFLACNDKLTEVFLLAGGNAMKDNIGLTGKLGGMAIYEDMGNDGVVNTVASFKIGDTVVTTIGKAVIKVAQSLASVFKEEELLKANIELTVNSKKGANGVYPILEVKF